MIGRVLMALLWLFGGLLVLSMSGLLQRGSVWP